MTFQITPSSLADAARTMSELAHEVHDTSKIPHLNAERGPLAMIGTSVAAAIHKADDASTQAKSVLESRFEAFSELLYSTAEHFKGTDTELADKLENIGDLNSTGA